MEALVEVVSELAAMDEPRRRLAGIASGLDIHLDLGEGHPLLGRRMPDLDLVTADGPVRFFELLHAARPVLLNLGAPGAFDITPWADRVGLVDASYGGEWELPVLGAVSAPSAVLVRPDGHAAWVGDGTDEGLTRRADHLVRAARTRRDSASSRRSPDRHESRAGGRPRARRRLTSLRSPTGIPTTTPATSPSARRGTSSGSASATAISRHTSRPGTSAQSWTSRIPAPPAREATSMKAPLPAADSARVGRLVAD